MNTVNWLGLIKNFLRAMILFTPADVTNFKYINHLKKKKNKENHLKHVTSASVKWV
jgi:hypothetical protein